MGACDLLATAAHKESSSELSPKRVTLFILPRIHSRELSMNMDGAYLIGPSKLGENGGKAFGEKEK